MRPVYESSADIENEKACAEYIQKRNSDCVLYKLPKLSCFDYVVCSNDALTCFIEIKCRNNPKQKYKTYMISKRKVDLAICLYQLVKIPTVLFVRWSDTCGMLNISTAKGIISTGGRKDRGDPKDIEKVVHFNVGLFS